MLTFDGVCFDYRSPALTQVGFALSAGTRTGLIGINGAGKSTLLSIAAGGRHPDHGQVHVREHALYGPGRRRALRLVSYMPQEASFPSALTAREIVEYLTWMRGHTPTGARRRTDEALEKVGLGPQRNTRFGRLSGGMRRRVALAQAIAPEADVLLLDEPSTGLDPQQRRLMVDAVAGLDGCVLMSSHVMEDIVAVASEVLVLHEGRLLFDGPLDALGTSSPSSRTASPAEAGPAASPAETAEAGFLALISRA